MVNKLVGRKTFFFFFFFGSGKTYLLLLLGIFYPSTKNNIKLYLAYVYVHFSYVFKTAEEVSKGSGTGRSNFFKIRRYFYCDLCVIFPDETHFKDLWAWRWHTGVGEELEVWRLRGNYKQELNQVSLSLSMGQWNSWGWTVTNWKCAPDPQRQCSLWRLPERNASLVWKTSWIYKRTWKFRIF